MFANPPGPCHLVAVAARPYHPPSISCTFEFNWSTPLTFYSPQNTYLPNIRSLLSQSGLLFHYLHVLLHTHSSSHFAFLYSISLFYSPTYLPSHPYATSSQPSPLLVHQPPANTFLQTCTREDILLEIFATARDSFPFVASTAPGQDPLVAGLLFSACRIRALTSFIPCRWMRAMERLFFCLSSMSEVEARFVGPREPNDEVDSPNL